MIRDCETDGEDIIKLKQEIEKWETTALVANQANEILKADLAAWEEAHKKERQAHERMSAEAADFAAKLAIAREALIIAKFLTSDEPEVDYGSGPECSYCDVKTSSDGEYFDHRPSCEWWQFRQMIKKLEIK